jgi:hypothetical protein
MAMAEQPFACNLKAFSPAERADWQKRLDRVMLGATSIRELSDGYSFQIDPRQASFAEVARWIELERKCCSFFVFDLSLQGEDGSVRLSLRGRDGVKQFIAEDFRPLFDRLETKTAEKGRR